MRFLRTCSLCLTLLLIGAGFAAAQPAGEAAIADTSLGLAPEIRTGQLDNGLRYYIRPNTEPDDRVELRLVVNAGSLLETEEQRGLAHFLEHMLFNGTEQFEKQELIDFLEGIGMRFGPDVNAYTSFDETVYQLTVPTDSAGLVPTAFDVLRDWAGRATLAADEIEKERGVVIEEWRQRQQTAQGRMQPKVIDALFYNSRYQDRLPIGDTTVIRNAPPEQIRSFYTTWYRPNLMSVVAVGDVNPDSIEGLIRDRFAGLENPDHPDPRPTYDVPGHPDTKYGIVTDPEFPVSVVNVYFKKDADPLETTTDYRRELATQLFYNLLNQRLREKVRSGQAPFLGAQAFESGFARTEAIYGMGAQVPDDSVTAGLEALLLEVARVRRHGFTPTELVRQKRSVLSAYETAYKDRNNQKSSSLADELVRTALTEEPAPGIAQEYRLVQALLPTIDVSMLNARAADLFGTENRVVLVQMPEKENTPPPTETDLQAVFDRVQAAEVSPYEDAVADVPLLPDVPEPSAVTARTAHSDLGVTEVRLANGVRVVVKPTDFKDDEIQFTASSPGGWSQVPDSVFATARHADALIRRSGVGTFTATALEKKLAGQTVQVTPYVGGREEGLRGSASPEDVETMFQLMHLYVTAPRADAGALQAYQKQQIAYLQNRASTPGAAFQDSLTAALYGDHPRVGPPTIAEVESLTPERLLELYQARFADVSDFTFTFAGNVSADSLVSLAQTYLGTLPAAGRMETVRDVQPALPNEAVTETVRAGIGDRSRVLLMYHGPLDGDPASYTRETRHRLRSLKDALSIRLRKELREERSGVYGVGVNANTQSAPKPRYTFSISFTCDPDRVEELLQATRAEVDSVRTGAVDDALASTVREQQRRSRETALETNGFWVSALDFTFTTEGEVPAQILTYNEEIEAVTPASIAETARAFLLESQTVEAVLLPERDQ